MKEIQIALGYSGIFQNQYEYKEITEDSTELEVCVGFSKFLIKKDGVNYTIKTVNVKNGENVVTVDESISYSLFDLVSALIKIKKANYKIIPNDTTEVYFYCPIWIETTLETVPFESTNDIGVKLVKASIIKEVITPYQLAKRYFNTNNIHGGWNMCFEMTVYSSKVAKLTRTAANTLLLNPQTYEDINHPFAKQSDNLRGYINYTRFNRFILSEEVPLDEIIVYTDYITPKNRAFIITENGYFIHPNIKAMGYILKIGEISDHFGDR